MNNHAAEKFQTGGYVDLSGVPRRRTVQEKGLIDLLPCVLYGCDEHWVVRFVSEGIARLTGCEVAELAGRPLSWERIVFEEDLPLISERLEEFKTSGEISVIHRVRTAGGLPLWVSHAIRRVRVEGGSSIHGCLTPIPYSQVAGRLDHGAASRFVHKLGNYFQLMNLLIGSLRVRDPGCDEIGALQEALDKTVELTRTFAEYSQAPAWTSLIDVGEVLSDAVASKKPLFARKGVLLESDAAEAIHGATVEGDPYLLEAAFSAVLQNALEATEEGGAVRVLARLDRSAGASPIASIRVSDSGCGMDEKMLGQATAPFVTSKKNHDGLGLALAARFLEMHGGLLRIKSGAGRGTEVEMALPARVPWEFTQR
ncbi:MAG TPA: PAS domain-containing sensor histidine kinase [candidate division Zixibacteria bacterium]|nr:PAS domain-containing sensor histidine kinase [candidate division Zixibacteria bacterium]